MLKVHGCSMEEVKEDDYLGDIVNFKGNNGSNIKNRVRKGI